MSIQKIIVGIIILIAVVVTIVSFSTSKSSDLLTVKDFKTCEASGYPIMESYPRQCRTPEGTLYVEEISVPEAPITSITTIISTTTISTTTPKPPGTTTPVVKECKPSGCSSQVCSDEPVSTNCMYQEVYSCYKTAACERQTTGQCGWTETEELLACIEEKTQR